MTAKVGNLLADYFDGQANIGQGASKSGDENLVNVLALIMPTRVPSNVETAAFTAAANDTWEDYDLIAALNAVLTTDIRTGEAVRLLGTLELVNAEAAVNNVKYGHGGMPDDDDTVRTFAMTGAIGSDFIQGVELITDDEGKIKIETDDITNVTFVFHLESYQVVRTTAGS
jgi:hypothetical protein